MARVGPNQDINDPTTIIDLAYQYQQQSDFAGNMLAQSNSENPNVTGSPIVDVSIPFKRTNGSTQLLQGSNIDYDDGYIYNTDLVSDSTIITYVFLAERFRGYWEALNNILDQLNSYDYLEENNIESVSGITYGSLGGTEYGQTSYSFSPSESLLIPTWQGSGLTNYNQSTYPQLLSALSTISIQRQQSLTLWWDTIYRYGKFIDNTGGVRSASAGFTGRAAGWPLDQQYVQFYNSTSNPIEISLSIDISATFSVNFTTFYQSWAEIDDINSYPDPFGGIKAFLPSSISHSESKGSSGGTIILSTNRTVEIPSGKSAFIGASAGASTTFFEANPPNNGSISITITLNDQTITHSAILA